MTPIAAFYIYVGGIPITFKWYQDFYKDKRLPLKKPHERIATDVTRAFTWPIRVPYIIYYSLYFLVEHQGRKIDELDEAIMKRKQYLKNEKKEK